MQKSIMPIQEHVASMRSYYKKARHYLVLLKLCHFKTIKEKRRQQAYFFKVIL